jgi:hypothetical protein
MKPTGITAAKMNGTKSRLNSENLPIVIKNKNAKKNMKKPGIE